MAFSVEFGSISKKKNSTKTDFSVVGVYDCIMLDPCSVSNPKLRLYFGRKIDPTHWIGPWEDQGPGDGASQWNYCHISLLHRYYFITEVNWTQEGWVFGCQCDVMASFKDDILAMDKAYIARSFQEFDGYVYDNLYPAKATLQTSVISGIASDDSDNPWKAGIDSGGVYIVGIKAGTTQYLAFKNAVDVQNFFKDMYSDRYCDQVYAGGAEWKVNYKQLKAILNPSEYISSIMWFPFIDVGGVSIDAKTVGWGSVMCPGAKLLSEGDMIVSEFVKFPFFNYGHPQIERGAYLNTQPYTKMVLHAPPFPDVTIDPGIFLNGENHAQPPESVSIIGRFFVDMKTGTGALEIRSDGIHNGILISRVYAPVGVPVEVTAFASMGGFSGQNPPIQYSLGIIGRNATLDIGKMISGISTEAFDNNLLFNMPVVMSAGSPGGRGGLRGSWEVDMLYNLLCDEDKEDAGRPLLKIRSLSGFSGYVQLVHADDFKSEHATSDETQAICAKLVEGFYIE